MSDNYEKITPAEETVEQEEVQTAVDTAETEVEAENEAEEVVLEVEDIEEENPEKDMTIGAKLKVLLMKPLSTSIIKWSCIFLGIVGLVLYLIATSDRATGEAFAKAFSGVSNGIAVFFGLFPIPMFEIVICATAVGIFAYLVFIIVKTILTKGAFHKGGLWVQFGYTLLAVAGIFALLCSMCYGVFTYRRPLSKQTGVANAKSTKMELSESMLYLIDNINNTLYEGSDSIFFTKSGYSRYATKGRSTEEITKKVAEAFDAASKDIPTLKGSKLNSKELLFADLYTEFQISSIYSPFTGELCINTNYPEVVVPMQVAKTMAIQRGYTDDGDADFIAFLVCTEYSDEYYIQYSGYFNAYVHLSSAMYNENGKNLHLYIANTLRDKAKREYVQYVKKLDSLYNVTSELEYIPSKDELSPSDYCDVAKLMLVNFRDSVSNGTIAIDEAETYNFGKYTNYLVNYYKTQASDFEYEAEDVYSEYHPSQN